MSAPSDDPLSSKITAVARRETGALLALYEEVSPRLFGLALRITRRRALAEQVLRDAFVAIWQDAPGFDSEQDDALAWIASRTRTRALAALAGSMPRNPPIDTPIEGLDRRTLDRLIDEKPAHLLRSALRSLPDGDRRAVLLAYLDGADYDEISLRLDVAPSSAMSWVRRGLYRLKQTGL
jgi:RNA polymerase sigma-70 factor (ECF subfamily)